MGLSYKDSGVDIEAGYAAVKKISKSVKKTFNSNVIDNFGQFGALFKASFKGFKEPLLVSSTDGVGTKLLLAIESGNHLTIGQDLVAMCVNDIITMGGKPLFMLDYLAVHQLDPEIVAEIVSGIADGCVQAGCALIGGETAEMRDVYRQGDYDMAGFVVGVVDRAKMINGSGMKAGDVILSLPSTGLHSNGYSLFRAVLNLIDDPVRREWAITQGMIPTRIYVKEVLNLIDSFTIKGIGNITGGGLYENVARILPAKLDAVIDPSRWNRPEIFDFVQNLGQIEVQEMYRTFNMGVGMILVVSPDIAQEISGRHEDIKPIGILEKGKGSVRINGVD